MDLKISTQWLMIGCLIGFYSFLKAVDHINLVSLNPVFAVFNNTDTPLVLSYKKEYAVQTDVESQQYTYDEGMRAEPGYMVPIEHGLPSGMGKHILLKNDSHQSLAFLHMNIDPLSRFVLVVDKDNDKNIYRYLVLKDYEVRRYYHVNDNKITQEYHVEKYMFHKHSKDLK